MVPSQKIVRVLRRKEQTTLSLSKCVGMPFGKTSDELSWLERSGRITNENGHWKLSEHGTLRYLAR